MVIVMSPQATAQEIERVVERLKRAGLEIHLSKGEERTIIGAVGDVRRVLPETLQVLPAVERVVRILHPFKLASREFQAEPTVVEVGPVPIGGAGFVVIAGPCSVENGGMLEQVARVAKNAGACMLRGGAFKPRTSPYSFQGLGAAGLELLARAREDHGMPVVTEVVTPEHVELVSAYADMLQIGARNMQNFALLQAAGKSRKPVLLKRGMMSSVEEWLQAAEYILSEGNNKVVLCERGIRTFESCTRNTLDLSAIAAAKKLSHLPVIADPSHATGRWDLVAPMAKAAAAAGADGIMVEVHPNPEQALSDGPQSLKPEVFESMMRELAVVTAAIGRPIFRVTESRSASA